jgi:hypothetical protein
MKKTTKLILVSFSLALSMSGCSSLFGPDPIPFVATKDYSLEVLKEVKEIDKKQTYLMEDLGLFSEETLPADLGASSILSKYDYKVKKYNNEPLLFPNFGVKNYIYFLIEAKGTDSWNDAEARAQRYGFKNVKDMYSHIYQIVHNESANLIYYKIKSLENLGLVDLTKIVKKENINLTINRIISKVYGTYLKYDNIEEPEILKEWYISLDDTKISFKREDYEPFALTILIMNELLSNKNKDNKVIVNGF